VASRSRKNGGEHIAVKGVGNVITPKNTHNTINSGNSVSAENILPKDYSVKYAVGGTDNYVVMYIKHTK
jgi:hypothetical protein